MDQNNQHLLEEIERLKAKLSQVQQVDTQESTPSSINLALQETNTLLQEIFDATQDLILLFQEDGTLLFLNNSCKNTLGFSPEELQEKHLYKFVEPSQIKNLQSKLKLSAQSEVHTEIETIFLNKQKEKVYLRGAITSQQESGQPIFRAILNNYSQQFKAQRAQVLYYNIAKELEKGVSLKELFHQLYLELNKLMDIDSFLVFVKDSDTKNVQTAYHVNSNHLDCPGIHGEEFGRVAIRLRRARFYNEEKLREIAPKHRLEFTPYFPKTWLAVPLTLRRVPVGAVVVQSFRKENDYTEEDLDLLNFIAGQLSSAIVRRQNEQKIKSQTARLEAIFNSGSHLMWSINTKGEITKYNENFSNTVWEHYQIMPSAFMPYTQISDRRVYGFYQQWITGYEQAFNGENQQFEITFVNDAGTEQWYEIFLNPIFNSEDEVNEVAAVASNITQKKAFDLVLQENEEKFRNIFNSFQDVYFRADMDGIINMVSPSVIELVGESQAEVVGKSVTEYYISPNKLEYLRKVLLEEGSVKNFESTLVDKTQKSKSIISNFRLFRDTKGNPDFIEGVARDITNLRKATEELRKAKDIAEKSLAIRKQFLSNMSHEIRTPMNGVIGMIDILSNTQLDPEQKGYVNTIKKSSETLLTILNDILDLSKIEAGKMKLRKTPVSLARVMDKLQALFLHQAKAKNTILSYKINKKLPDFIMADETRLLQILANLTSNAIKFTEDGFVKINLLPEEQKGDNFSIRFMVEDSGIGISRENLDLLFKQFSQVDSSYTKSFGGTGLGLSISQELTRMMDGDIGVTSERYRGSTFWFTIHTRPCTLIEVEEMEKSVDYMPNNQLQQTHKVLVVDDNTTNLEVARIILEKAGCEVTTAQSGPIAIDLVQEFSFEVIFMDIQMPSMNGMSATKRIKKALGRKTPPIIAMTAFSLQEEREEFLSAGMDDYIAKPIRAQQLIGMVTKWAEKGGQSTITAPSAIEKTSLLSKTTEEQESIIPILDMEVISQLAQYGGLETVVAVLEDFITEAEELVRDCQASILGNNTEGALSILHTLKGSSGTVGVAQVAAKSAYIEAKLKKENWENIPEDLQELKKDFELFLKEYKNILDLPE